jgi:lipoprotein-anchoring transpeptidase ErfK/SrfK
MIPWFLAIRRFAIVALLAAGFAVLLPNAAVPADAVVSWSSAMPAEGTVLGVSARTRLYFRLAADAPAPVVSVRIRTSGPTPRGAVLHSTDGNPAQAAFVWNPSASQVGEYRVTFSAATEVPNVGATRTVVIRVGPAGKPPPGPAPPAGVYPKRFVLSDRSSETYRWAFVRHRTVARSGPASSAHALSPITFRTPELYRNAVLALDGVKYYKGRTWVRIRLAVLPNGATGWVPRGSLTDFQTIHTRMLISHSRMRATLYKRGRPIFSTSVGVGQPHWPTPRGEFYIREKLSGYYSPAYGPRAFGLNARSSVLTDWPGGGFIGIHGTNAPGLIPGRISHGCVRVRNAAIMRLFRLMPLGTPVTIQ